MNDLRLLAQAGCLLLLGCALSSPPAHAQLAQLQPLQELEPDDAEVFPTPDELVPVGFGTDVAIEGNRAFISMPEADRSAGRIAIFHREASGEWRRAGQLRFPGTPNGVRQIELQGGIAIAASQDTLYVFRPKTSNGMPPVRKLKVDARDFISDLEYDGQTAVVGTSGGVYVFTINQRTIARQQKIISPSGLASDAFGSSVAVFGDTLIVGAPGYNDSQGAVHVYRLRGTKWVRTQTLLAPDGEAFDGFGTALTVRHGLMVVGAPGADPAYEGEFGEVLRMGAAFLFAPRADRWLQTRKLTPLDDGMQAYLNFGSHIEINGGRVVIGSPGIRGLSFEAGSLFVYERQGNKLSALAQAIESNELGYAFAVWGTSVIAGIVEPTFFTGRALVFDLNVTQ
ncbi:MAG: hypothetical protein ABW110_10745 [Steroidobacteraceae bacterium]